MLKIDNLLSELDFLENLDQLETELVKAGSRYLVNRLSHIATNQKGELFIKWAGSPNPGPCGSPNYGWVILPNNSAQIHKDLALSAYLQKKPVRIDTVGCTGRFETVNYLFTPIQGA